MDPLKKQRLKTPFHIQVELVFVMTSNKVRTKKKRKKDMKEILRFIFFGGFVEPFQRSSCSVGPLDSGITKEQLRRKKLTWEISFTFRNYMWYEDHCGSHWTINEFCKLKCRQWNWGDTLWKCCPHTRTAKEIGWMQWRGGLATKKSLYHVTTYSE